MGRGLRFQSTRPWLLERSLELVTLLLLCLFIPSTWMSDGMGWDGVVEWALFSDFGFDLCYISFGWLVGLGRMAQ